MKKQLLLLLITFLPVAFAANEPPEKPIGITIELNKLSQSKENCITYFVLHNQTDDSFTEFKTEFVIFDKKGFINSVILGDFKKVRSGKTLVKPFGIPKTTCADIDKILINDVRQCKVGETAKTDCLDLLKPSNKSTTTLFK